MDSYIPVYTWTNNAEPKINLNAKMKQNNGKYPEAAANDLSHLLAKTSPSSKLTESPSFILPEYP